MRKSIAVIGAGIGGLTAAHVIQASHDVTLYDAEPRLGGHAHTHVVTTSKGDRLFLDTGFIVYNTTRYPLLTRLFADLSVSTCASDMSFSVECDGCGLSYVTGSTLRSPPTRPRSVDRGTWTTVLGEIGRFNALSHDSEITLAALLEREGFSDYFASHIVLPLVSAVWSCGPQSAKDYPAGYLLTFLANHGLLHSSGQEIRWRTVAGGSVNYVTRLASHLSAVRLSTRVAELSRQPGGVEITDDAGRRQLFHAVVVATHPADALRLLAEPSETERRVLGAISYVPSTVVLHTDSSLLPRQDVHRAAWNYRQSRCVALDSDAQMSYHLNRLQRLPGDIDYIVTLNAARPIPTQHVIAEMEYEHPFYTPDSLAAQRCLSSLNSPQIAFAGAYHGWGFHEDGCRAGLVAARALGVEW